MPGIRTPTNILTLRGADKKHPDRMRERENEPENVNPLGTAPKELNATEKKYYKRIGDESIPGVLGEADRIAVSMAAKLLALAYSEEGATAAQLGQLFKYLSQFGMTPADRSKINLPGKKKSNAFDE
ncbi:MAG: P27 family phage terminase small subunit [Ketobacter sp.]|nr:P27 family phage terminase small subunit [Ketobacter sp.]